VLKKAVLTLTSWRGSTGGQEGRRDSWPCSLACIPVRYVKLCVLHIQCKAEINPAIFREEPGTGCKVIGNVAGAGLQQSSRW